ncbi:MAG: hypothetical protein ABSC01_02065 [Verrucomicrobiota bacterium]|jgi:hypothetical protein
MMENYAATALGATVNFYFSPLYSPVCKYGLSFPLSVSRLGGPDFC